MFATGSAVQRTAPNASHSKIQIKLIPRIARLWFCKHCYMQRAPVWTVRSFKPHACGLNIQTLKPLLRAARLLKKLAFYLHANRVRLSAHSSCFHSGTGEHSTIFIHSATGDKSSSRFSFSFVQVQNERTHDFKRFNVMSSPSRNGLSTVPK